MNGGGDDALPLHTDATTNAEDKKDKQVPQSKGSWIHAGYHLTGATAGPALLSLPYAFAFIGWGPGIFALLLGGGLSFYAYSVLIGVLEHFESDGKRFVCFGDLADHVMGKKLSMYLISPLQFIICFVTVIGAILVGGVCMKEIYDIYNINDGIKLYHFIVLFGALTAALSQLPSFHSLRHVNFMSLLLCLGYSLLATYGSIISGSSPDAPARHYNVSGDAVHKTFGIFGALSIISNSFGNAATVAPPVKAKMFKGLLLCYAVAMSTFISVAVAGYWAFGNAAQSNIFDNMAPKTGHRLVPKTLLVTAYVFIFVQLIAVSVVYLQPAFEVMEAQFTDQKHGRFLIQKWILRLLGRSMFVAVASLFAAMLPFFGDINALMGALGYTPLVFVFPILFSLKVFKPSKWSCSFWFHSAFVVIFSVLTILGSLAAIGQISMDAYKFKLFSNGMPT